MNLTDRLITEIVGKCDGLSITAEQASNILAYLQYGAPLDDVRRDAERYRKLRDADINAVHKGGVFAGLTPDNVVINGEDLDIAVDLLIDDASPQADAAPLPREAATVALTDEAIVDALKSAKQFIANGVALGYIRMPDADCPDPAHDTPKKIDAALALLAAAANGEQA